MAKRVKVASAYVSVDGDSRGLDKTLANISRRLTMPHAQDPADGLFDELVAAGELPGLQPKLGAVGQVLRLAVFPFSLAVCLCSALVYVMPTFGARASLVAALAVTWRRSGASAAILLTAPRRFKHALLVTLPERLKRR